MNAARTVAVTLLLCCWTGCGGDEPDRGAAPAAKPAPAPTPQEQPKQPERPRLKLPPRFDMTILRAYFGGEPSAPPAPDGITPAQVELGRTLFATTALAADGGTSCATCHDLDKHGQDGRVAPEGLHRNTPSVLNAARQLAQFWDGRAPAIEDVPVQHVLALPGYGLADEAELTARLRATPELVTAFGRAFGQDGEPVSGANFGRALGAYLRTLVTRSPFDDFLAGNNNALTTQQKHGLKAFIDVGCTTCHTTQLVGGNLFQKLGAQRPYPADDQGRFAVTGNEGDRFFFKVPQLLNVATTGPYLHNGSLATLDETVAMMGQAQLNVDLDPEQVAAIAAFLESMTGTLPTAAQPGGDGAAPDPTGR